MKVNFTKHGLKRMEQRKISAEELKNTLQYGICLDNDSNSKSYEYADLKIIAGLQDEIITLYRCSNAKDTNPKVAKKSLQRKARVQHRQRLNAIRKAEHYQEIRAHYSHVR